MNKINRSQIKIIYTLAQGLNLVDKTADVDQLHELVYSITKKEHISNLSNQEAINVIDNLKKHMKGFSNHMSKPDKQVSGMASEGQINKMWALMYELKSYDKEKSKISLKYRLHRFIKKYARIDDIKFLTYKKANSVIEGIKGMIESEKRKMEGL